MFETRQIDGRNVRRHDNPDEDNLFFEGEFEDNGVYGSAPYSKERRITERALKNPRPLIAGLEDDIVAGRDFRLKVSLVPIDVPGGEKILGKKWAELALALARNRGGVCEYCGSEGTETAIEKWFWDWPKHTARLIDIECACVYCRAAMRLDSVSVASDVLVAHACRVNNCFPAQWRSHVELSLLEFEQLCKIQWRVDYGKHTKRYGIKPVAEIRWVSDIPTLPGMYYFRKRKDTAPMVAWVNDNLHVFYAGYTQGWTLEQIGSGEWAGPYPLP